MVQFLHLEKRNSGVIDTNDAVVFNVELQSGGYDIEYDDETGVITFAATGTFYVNWSVAQQTGLATDGSNFAIVTSDAAENAVGSNHVKISQTNGFAVLKIETPNTTARLVNVSDASATLSDTTQVKASLAIFGLASDARPTLGYLQAQVSAVFLTLDPGDPIDFDAVIVRDPYDIVTKDLTEFTLANPGTYLVTWEIPVDATDREGFAGFSIMLDGVPHSSSRMPLAIGVVSGSAMVITENADSALEIVNSTGDIVRITEQANVVITQTGELVVPAP